MVERRRRRRGDAITRMIQCPDGRLADRRIWWIMLVSDYGAGLITQREQLYDAKDKRHRIRAHWYELVRVPRPDMRPSWTWRVPPAEWRQHVEHACALARHNEPAQAQHLIDRELRRPGFRGLRWQRRELFRSMWLARGHRRPPLVFPGRIPWVGMVRADGVRLGDLMRGSNSSFGVQMASTPSVGPPCCLMMKPWRPIENSAIRLPLLSHPLQPRTRRSHASLKTDGPSIASQRSWRRWVPAVAIVAG